MWIDWRPFMWLTPIQASGCNWLYLKHGWGFATERAFVTSLTGGEPCNFKFHAYWSYFHMSGQSGWLCHKEQTAELWCSVSEHHQSTASFTITLSRERGHFSPRRTEELSGQNGDRTTCFNCFILWLCYWKFIWQVTTDDANKACVICKHCYYRWNRFVIHFWWIVLAVSFKRWDFQRKNIFWIGNKLPHIKHDTYNTYKKIIIIIYLKNKNSRVYTLFLW